MTHCRVPPEPSVRARARNERSLFHSVGRCLSRRKTAAAHDLHMNCFVNCLQIQKRFTIGSVIEYGSGRGVEFRTGIEIGKGIEVEMECEIEIRIKSSHGDLAIATYMGRTDLTVKYRILREYRREVADSAVVFHRVTGAPLSRSALNQISYSFSRSWERTGRPSRVAGARGRQ
ncbi:hypothetical protein EVAR_9549_1 [Eumeta japonica]|uniref:Uncharacterized protein n=1 Tax=Eumeta variegata TaxID=151549 RepID=A0A4C1U3Z3_EUMVA|nr:hypothetical protein EVAR_9549_1 [Eumeta japonica]